MGKTRKQVKYDQQALHLLATEIVRFRQPLSGNMIPELMVDETKLEEAVKELPKKEREILEKFWGLIPGTKSMIGIVRADTLQDKFFRNLEKYPYCLMGNLTLIDYLNFEKLPIEEKVSLEKLWSLILGTKNTISSARIRMLKDKAFRDLVNHSYRLMEKLTSIDYLHFFDKNVKELIEKIVSKINREGCEDISDIDSIRYILIFLIFMSNGPQMIYEDNNELDVEKEEEGGFDKYALLKYVWEHSYKNLPDASINLQLLIGTLEMLNIQDVVTMKKYVGLSVPKEFDDSQIPQLDSFRTIREFKERIFSEGSWETTEFLICGGGTLQSQKANFMEEIHKIMMGHPIYKYKTATKEVKLSTGTKTLDAYNIGGLKFTDEYECMVLYLNRRIW